MVFLAFYFRKDYNAPCVLEIKQKGEDATINFFFFIDQRKGRRKGGDRD